LNAATDGLTLDGPTFDGHVLGGPVAIRHQHA